MGTYIIKFRIDYRTHPLENECRFWIETPSRSSLNQFILSTILYKQCLVTLNYYEFYESINRPSLECKQQTPQTVSQSNNTKILVQKSTKSKPFKCFWKHLNLNKESSTWKEIKEHGIQLKFNSNHFRVKCTSTQKGHNNKTLFNDVFYGFEEKELKKNEIVENDALSYNIILLVLDGVNQYQFLREMPRTMRYLKSFDASLMQGFSDVSFFTLISGGMSLNIDLI